MIKTNKIIVLILSIAGCIAIESGLKAAAEPFEAPKRTAELSALDLALLFSQESGREPAMIVALLTNYINEGNANMAQKLLRVIEQAAYHERSDLKFIEKIYRYLDLSVSGPAKSSPAYSELERGLSALIKQLSPKEQPSIAPQRQEEHFVAPQVTPKTVEHQPEPRGQEPVKKGRSIEASIAELKAKTDELDQLLPALTIEDITPLLITYINQNELALTYRITEYLQRTYTKQSDAQFIDKVLRSIQKAHLKDNSIYEEVVTNLQNLLNQLQQKPI